MRCLIFGGTGSLGYSLNSRLLENDISVYNFSRDESKHWEMKNFFQHDERQHFIIGNVASIVAVEQAIIRINPHIIIIASAMKHIDQCETNTRESLNTNVIGTTNILDVIERKYSVGVGGVLDKVIFVSSDKACSPINHYGFCKAMSESLMVEKSHFVPNIKFITVRYGNVLNSRGSIIPLLHNIGNDPKRECFNLTHPDMTRFVMSLDDSVDLILHAVHEGESGDIIIPQLVSMRIIDLLEIFSTKYNKPIKIIGLRSNEKIVETLINETQALRVIKSDEHSYLHIKSIMEYPHLNNTDGCEYNSNMGLLTKEELFLLLQELQLY